jgi:hypothetical protein
MPDGARWQVSIMGGQADDDRARLESRLRGGLMMEELRRQAQNSQTILVA